MLGISVTNIGIYQAIRRKTKKTLIEGLVFILLAFLMIWLDHSTSAG